MPRGLGALATVVAVVALAVLVFTGEPSDADRGDSLATRLRCPVCQSESVADSTSQTARDMRALIDEQIASGASDDEVIDFFVASYGEWIVLDAPPRGRTLVLWVLPAAVAVLGVGVIVARKRKPAGSAVDPAALEEDQRDVTRQLAMGEIDPEVAASLLATYAKEAKRPQAAAAKSSRLPRLLAGTAVLVVGVGIVVFAVVKATDPREEGGLLTGGGATDAAPLDPASVSNEELEAVIAANPDVIPMRLALARRYFNEGDFGAALPHYMVVLETEAHPEALANVGWMAYVSDQPETAVAYLEESLQVDPDYTQAQWFLANVLMFGLDDPAGAEPLIRSVLAVDNIPEEVRAEAEELLVRATSS